MNRRHSLSRSAARIFAKGCFQSNNDRPSFLGLVHKYVTRDATLFRPNFTFPTSAASHPLPHSTFFGFYCVTLEVFFEFTPPLHHVMRDAIYERALTVRAPITHVRAAGALALATRLRKRSSPLGTSSPSSTRPQISKFYLGLKCIVAARGYVSSASAERVFMVLL